MLLTVWKSLKRQWKCFNKLQIVLGFVATMLGVLVAFGLRGCGEQRALDSATKQRLHIAVLESQYIGTDAVEIMRVCESSGNISIRRPDTVAAAAAFGDANILAVLPKHEVSMLRAYINAVATLNEALQVHRSVLVSAGRGPTPAEGAIRENLRSNAAAVVANVVVLQEELSHYFDEADYDHEEMKRIEDRVKDNKAKALRGNVSLSKEE